MARDISPTARWASRKKSAETAGALSFVTYHYF
jgi:hypothetical protein